MKCVCGDELVDGECPTMEREIEALMEDHVKRTSKKVRHYWDFRDFKRKNRSNK